MADYVKVNGGRQIALYRANTVNASLSATQYLPALIARIGASGSTPTVSTTDINQALPISDGTTLDDGSNQLTGSSGADNSTDQTTTYKEGAGNTDVTAQNLIANDTNATKIWTIADLSSNGTNAAADQYTSLWFYILDQTALDKFLSSGTALEIKLGSDSSNYYSKTYTAADLSIGWNLLYLDVLNTNTETGTVGTPIDTFIIEVTTNNATDEFAAGDVIYDLLRQWEIADTRKNIQSGFPVIDLTNLNVTKQFLITATEANGFLADQFTLWNNDTTPLLSDMAFIDDDSKSSTDQWKLIFKERIL